MILVDDKFEIDHDNIVEMLKTVTNQPVKYVINTHYHGDHSGGNAKLQVEGTLAVASVNARARMVETKQTGLPDITVQPRGSIWLGGKTAEIYWFGRAHTDGDVVVLFPQNRVLAAGDMYTNGEGTPQLIDYSGGGSAKEWTATVDKRSSSTSTPSCRGTATSRRRPISRRIGGVQTSLGARDADGQGGQVEEPTSRRPCGWSSAGRTCM